MYYPIPKAQKQEKMKLWCLGIHYYAVKGFPGGPVIKNPPSNAGDAGSILGQRTMIPHATGQLSLHTTAKELAPQLRPNAAKYMLIFKKSMRIINLAALCCNIK